MEIEIVLTQTAVQKLKVKPNRYRKTDFDGLIIEVLPSKSKVWKYRYTFNGKRRMVTLGFFPHISLSRARQLRDEAKDKVLQGEDPSHTKKALQKSKSPKSQVVQTDNTDQDSLVFNQVFEEFVRRKAKSYGDNKPEWGSKTYSTHLKRLKKHVFPFLGDTPVKDIDTGMVESRLLAIQESGTLETRDKVFTVLKQVFEFAKASKYIEVNPVKEVSTSLFVKKKPRNYSHVTTEEELKNVLKTLNNLKGSFEVVSCIQMSMHIFLRASEIVGMKWSEVDFDNKTINRATTKSAKTNEAKPLIIPISTQVEAMLRGIKKVTGATQYVFKSHIALGHISSNSLNKNIRDNGLKGVLSLHGMRHTASTFLHEMDFNSDDIELQLNHEIGGIRGVYNKARRLEQRKVMMQAWSDYLDSLS